MPDNEDWLYRPVLKGLVDYKDLKNGVVDLYDVAVLNDAIDVQEENEFRYYEANE